MSVAMNGVKAIALTIMETALLPVWMTMELLLCHILMGWNAGRSSRHLSGLIGGISIGAIFMVYCYQSAPVTKLFKKRPFWFNLIVFNLINLPLAFFFYFTDLYICKFIANGADYSVGVVIH